MGETKIKIFLSYARVDREQVEELYQKLVETGFSPWMDTKDILGGELWETSIKNAIRGADFLLVFLSLNSVQRRGFFQKEIKKALAIWEEKLVDDIYLIPVRLVNCEVPEILQKFQYVDLYEPDGFERLVTAIREGARRGNTQSQPPDKRQAETSVGTQNSNTPSAMQKAPHSESIDNLSTDGNASTRAAINNPEIDNPTIWVKQHKIHMEIRPDKRVIRQIYLLSALGNDTNLYRFKLKTKGSGKIEVTKKSTGYSLDDQTICFGRNVEDWEYYAVVFFKTLRAGKSMEIELTFEAMDVNQDIPPFHALSYADVAGCDKLSMSITFLGPLLPDGIKLIRCDHKWNGIAPEEIYIKFKEIDDHTREYSFEITPERNVKYMVEWQPPSPK